MSKTTAEEYVDIVEEVEDYPTHRAVTIRYLNAAGIVVRQDLRIEIKQGLFTEGTTNA